MAARAGAATTWAGSSQSAGAGDVDRVASSQVFGGSTIALSHNLAFTVPAHNQGPATLSLDELSAAPLRRPDSRELGPRDLRPGIVYRVARLGSLDVPKLRQRRHDLEHRLRGGAGGLAFLSFPGCVAYGLCRAVLPDRHGLKRGRLLNHVQRHDTGGGALFGADNGKGGLTSVGGLGCALGDQLLPSTTRSSRASRGLASPRATVLGHCCMKTIRFLLVAIAVAAPLTSTFALDRVLPAPRTKESGDIRLSDNLKIGRFQGSGSTGDVSGASVTGLGASGSQTLANFARFVADNTETISTLRALPTAPLAPNVTVVVSGYYAAGDGGGGRFTWSPTSAAADDAALTIRPSAVSGTGRWVRVVDGPLSIRMFGAHGDGIADDGPIIRAAYVAATALGQRVLSCPAGTYRVASRVFLTSGVILSGGRDCVMRAADNGSDILFEVFESNNVGLEGITIDGNRDNNFANYKRNDKALIHLRSAANSFVRGVAFKDGPGIGIASYGDNVDVSNNSFDNVRDRAIFHTGSVTAFSKNFTARNNRINGSFSHAINIGYADAFDITNNAISGHVIGLRSTMRVNVAGAMITFVSGPENFRNVKPGQFLVMDRGKEWYVVGKLNDTTIAVAGNGVSKDQFPPVGDNQVAMVGSGDLFGMDSVRNGKVQGNLIGNAATFGGGIISSGGAVNNVLFAGNAVYRTGKHGFIVSAEAQSATIAHVKLLGNAFDEAGAGSDAVSDFERTSVAVVAGQGSVTSTSIDGTTVSSDTSSYGPVLNWLGFDLNMQPGTVTLGKANVSAVLNGKAIANDVKSITLSPGWGAGATAGSVVSTGDRVDFVIRTGGTGLSGYPRGTISKVSDVGPQPAVQSVLRSSAAPGAIRHPLVVKNATAGNWPFTWTSGDRPGAPSEGSDPTTFVSSFVAH